MFQPNEVVVKNIAELSVRNLDSISRHLHSIKIVIFYLETFTSVVISHISQFGDMSRSDTFTRMMMGDQYGLEFSWPDHGHCEIFGFMFQVDTQPPIKKYLQCQKIPWERQWDRDKTMYQQSTQCLPRSIISQ